MLCVCFLLFSVFFVFFDSGFETNSGFWGDEANHLQMLVCFSEISRIFEGGFRVWVRFGVKTRTP